MSDSLVKDAAAQVHVAHDMNADLLSCPPQVLQRLLADAVRAYAARMEGGEGFPALVVGTDIAATDVMVTVTAMLKAVNIQAFELGMWQAWSGNH